MALIVADRVQETTTTTGTGTYTLAGAKDGFQSFAAVGDGNTTYYACTDGTDYEVGIGTFTLSGTTLARTTIIESSNSDAAVSWSAGSKDIFVTSPADKTLLVGRNLYVDNPSSPTAPSATGTNAVAIGNNASSSNTLSVAIGHNSVASNSYAFAMGAFTDATGERSLALGYLAQAITGQYATAISRSYASGADSFAAAIGNNTSSYGARGTGAIAMGPLAKTTSGSSGTVAIGDGAFAHGSSGVALGASYCGGIHGFAAGIGNANTNFGATGYNSVAMGRQAKSPGSYSIALGDSTDATGNYSVAIGHLSNADAEESMALGRRSHATVKGQLAFTSGYFSGQGDAQTSIFVLRSDTTDATAEALTTDNSAASTDNQIILKNKSAMSFTGTVVVREDATDGDDYAGWEIKGVIMRQGTVADTTLGVGIVNSLYHTAGLASASVALSADTTNGGLKIEVTGIAATNLRWVATVHTSEVVNA